jgi:hypothetical protein
MEREYLFVIENADVLLLCPGHAYAFGGVMFKYSLGDAPMQEAKEVPCIVFDSFRAPEFATLSRRVTQIDKPGTHMLDLAQVQIFDLLLGLEIGEEEAQHNAIGALGLARMTLSLVPE